MIPMPSKPWPIWLAAWLVLLSFPLISLLYWSEVSRSGMAESGGMGEAYMIGSVLFAPFLMMPVMFFATYFAVEDYDPHGSLLAWRPDRPVLSVAVSLVCGVPAVAVAVALLDGFPLGEPWFEWLWVPFDLLCIAWLLLVRAGALGRDAEGPVSDVFA